MEHMVTVLEFEDRKAFVTNRKDDRSIVDIEREVLHPSFDREHSNGLYEMVRDGKLKSKHIIFTKLTKREGARRKGLVIEMLRAMGYGIINATRKKQ